ncbi:aspartyl-phosphate phosphatase Spo0E family protein [Brevibacillus dissolubilis]|uniref:aspartyl-phosphate phosphatase Spo0E family protein n=1 Tax=Brevibacillus dissolubilis TaxID=1844116 RepID=UPI001116C7DA|nr:aspartyl-phosphate phosphatase Spo0E family protein [Brevibacillus dissolubilis]
MRDSILEKIELLRQQMVKNGLELGLSHPDVLEYSQRIDRLHNQLLELDSAQGKQPYRFVVFEKQAHFA